MELAVMVLLAATGVGLLAAISWNERRTRGPRVSVELRFGADVTAATVEAMLAAVAGLPNRSVVALDVVADHDGIRHLLHADQATLDVLAGQWRGMLPSLRLEPADVTASDWSGGAELGLSDSGVVLRRDAVREAAAALLGALQPLGRDEVLMLRWQLSPSRPPARSSTELEAVPARALREKYAAAVLEGVGVVAARAGDPKRAAHLVSRVVSVARSRRAGRGGLAARKRSRRWLARLDTGSIFGDSRFCPAELSALVGWPIGAPPVPGLMLGTAPLLVASRHIPRNGRVLAASTWPGEDRPLAQPVKGGLSHLLIAGPTGVGKTALVAALALQDIEAGRGCLVVDGKGGELVDAVLTRVPAARVGDVIVLDPARSGPVAGLRVFGRGSDAELTAELVLGIFADLFAASWGPLSSRWLRAGLVAAAHDEQASLADLPRVFADASYRRRLLARSDDPFLATTFAALDAMSPQERSHQLSAPLARLDEVIGRRVVRNVLAQPEPAIDMHEVLRQNKIVLVSLAPERIGVGARLIAALVLFKTFEAVMARPARRRPFFVYLDEPKVLGDIPVPLDSMFERARSADVGITLSPQSLMQLPSDLRMAAITNAASWIVFRQSSTDAKLLAPELPGVTAESLQHLGAFEAVFRIALGPGAVAAPASGRTYPPAPANSNPEAVRRVSAERYGTDPTVIEEAWRQRHDATDSEVPVGRVRRRS
jgi:DNA polymerase III delta prime subunit